MDQMYYLELNSPIIYADEDTFDCLFEKLKINKTLKSLILRNPRLYTGLGTYNVSRYYDGLNILYQKNAVLGLIEALKNNNTLVNLSLFGGLFYDDIQVLKNGLVNHPSLKKVTLEEEDFNVEGKALTTGCKCCCVLL